MARRFKLPGGGGLLPILAVGAFVIGAYYVYSNPQAVSSFIKQYTTPPAPPSSSTTAPTTTANVQSTAQSVVTPPLSQIESGGITPYFQNRFCDPTLGLNWDPLQGKCVRSIQGSSGRCAQGSVFNHCACQCVPANVPQPQCYRDCTTQCTDKINQQWSWCVLGCIPKSAAYGNPGLLACPPM